MATRTYTIRNLRNRNGSSVSGNWFKTAEIIGDMTGTALTNATITQVRLKCDSVKNMIKGKIVLKHNDVVIKGKLSPNNWEQSIALNTAMTGYTNNMFSDPDGVVSITFEIENSDGSIMFDVRTIYLEVTYYYNVSHFTLDKTEVEAGDSFVVNITSNSTSHSHKLKLAMGTKTATVSIAAGTENHTYVVPKDTWLPQMSTTFSAPMAVVLETYSGNEKLGEETKSIVIKCPDYTLVEPTATAALVTTINGTSFPNLGVYVQNKCATKITAQSAGMYGSTIKSLSVLLSGYPSSGYSARVADTDSLEMTSGLLTKKGTTTATVTATDSRGKTSKKEITINVLPYTAPAITSFSGFRANSDGTYSSSGTSVIVDLQANYTEISGTNNNQLHYKISWKQRSSTNWTTSVDTTTTDAVLLYNNALSAYETFGTLTQYDVKAEVWDVYTTAKHAVSQFLISSVFYPVHFSADGQSISFGQACNRTGPSFEIAEDRDVYVYGEELRSLFAGKSTEAIIETIKPLLRFDSLSDNSYFVNPINQRGLTSYSAYGYTIDRWIASGTNCQVSLSSSGMTIKNNETSGPVWLTQILAQEHYTMYRSAKLTIAIQMSDGAVYVKSGTPSSGRITAGKYAELEVPTGKQYLRLRIVNPDPGVSITVRRITVLPGAYTLENLPPFIVKNRSADLLECQRYFFRANTFRHPVLCYRTSTRSTFLLPTIMRAVPVITLTSPGTIACNGKAEIVVTGASVEKMGRNSILIGTTHAATDDIANHAGFWESAVFTLSAEPVE